MHIHLIWAQAKNRVIGYHGQMPWHLPEDLAHFKRLTLNAPVIMGRKTWDSLPERFRPLPNRRNIVLTRQENWGREFSRHQVIKTNSIKAAMTPQITGAGVDTAWVIGGGQIYAAFLPHAKRIEITQIDADFEGDTYAPELGPEWIEEKRVHCTTKSGIGLDFVTYLSLDGLKDEHQPSFPF